MLWRQSSPQYLWLERTHVLLLLHATSLLQVASGVVFMWSLGIPG